MEAVWVGGVGVREWRGVCVYGVYRDFNRDLLYFYTDFSEIQNFIVNCMYYH